MVSLLLLLLVSSPFPVALWADEIDDYLQSQLEEHDIPGLALLVVEEGRVTRSQGYGLAEVEHEVPVTSKTIFQSGSVGKQFTAAGVLLLAEDGKLSLDDVLAKHFPGAPSAWHRMTVRHLLSHTSGMHDYDLVSRGDGTSGDTLDLRRDYDEDELLAAMMREPLDFDPGSQWSYSNSGYVVAGILISKLADKHWSEFLAERVFEPAGMKTTTTIDERRIVKHRSSGYSKNEEGELVNQAWVSPTWGKTADGALYFSLDDLAAWEATLRERRVLSPSSYAEWWTPVALSGGGTYPYGLGWSLHEQRGRNLISHGGAWQGFRTHIGRFVDDDLTIAILTNASHANPGAMVTHVAGLIDEDLRMPTLEPAEAPAPSRERTESAARMRELLESWASWQKHDSMCAALAATAAGSPREAFGRTALGRRLEATVGFESLGSDVLDGLDEDSLHLHGETIRRIDYFALETDESRHRYRFLISDRGCVAGFAGG